MYCREWVGEREEENQGTCGLEVSSCSCDPDWRISIFITCADRVGIGGVDGTKDVVDVGAFFVSDEDVDWEASLAVFGGKMGFGREFRRVVVF